MVTFVKLGGSLITNKQIESSFRKDVVQRIAAEISAALTENAEIRLLVGHGSGSFGHFAAKRYGTIHGVHSPEEWRGFAEVATTASELNYLVAHTLSAENVPVWRIQPSASARASNGIITYIETYAISGALEHALVPLVFGDVALDDVRGGTIISTEAVFFYLAQRIPVKRVLLLGEVPGVYDAKGQVIPLITPHNYKAIESALGGSSGVDVTGGMETKVRDMLALTQKIAGLEIRIMDGREPGLLKAVLGGHAAPGTLITAG